VVIDASCPVLFLEDAGVSLDGIVPHGGHEQGEEGGFPIPVISGI